MHKHTAAKRSQRPALQPGRRDGRGHKRRCADRAQPAAENHGLQHHGLQHVHVVFWVRGFSWGFLDQLNGRAGPGDHTGAGTHSVSARAP